MQSKEQSEMQSKEQSEIQSKVQGELQNDDRTAENIKIILNMVNIIDVNENFVKFHHKLCFIIKDDDNVIKAVNEYLMTNDKIAKDKQQYFNTFYKIFTNKFDWFECKLKNIINIYIKMDYDENTKLEYYKKIKDQVLEFININQPPEPYRTNFLIQLEEMKLFLYM